MYIHTETYCTLGYPSHSSASGYTCTQEPTLEYNGAAWQKAKDTHTNLLFGYPVAVCSGLYIHTGTYSWVSWYQGTGTSTALLQAMRIHAEICS